MGAVLVLVIWMALAAGLSFLLRRPLGHTLPAACFGIILALYLFGLAGGLAAGVWVVALAALAALAYCLWQALAKKANWKKQLLTPGLAAFAVLFAVALWGHQGRVLTWIDEFSHWGLVVKNMTALDVLGAHPEATTVYRSYPPAVALFQYFWCKLDGAYREQTLFSAFTAMTFSTLLPVMEQTRWRRWPAMGLVFGTLMLAPGLFFSNAYNAVVVDAMLALVFAYIIYTYFSSGDYRAGRQAATGLALVLPALAVLALTKDSGIGLAAMAAALIAADLLLCAARNKEARGVARWRGLALWGGGMALVLAAARLSWKGYLLHAGAADYWGTSAKVTLGGVAGLFSLPEGHYRRTVLATFVRELATRPLGGGLVRLPALGWLVAGLGLGFLLWGLARRAPRGQTGSLMLLNLGLGVCGVGYFVSMLGMYLFLFTEDEAVNLASFNRYMGTWGLAAVLALLWLLLDVLLHRPDRGLLRAALPTAAVLAGVALMADFAAPLDVTLRARQSVAYGRQVRADYGVDLSAVAPELNTAADRVYVVNQNGAHLQTLIIDYELAPVKNNGYNGVHLVAEGAENRPGARAVDAGTWARELATDYTFVYLYRTDSAFIERYSELFAAPADIRDGTLYRVAPGGANGEAVRLEAAE